MFEQFWRRKIQSQGGSRVVLPLKDLGHVLSHLFQLVETLGIPWLGAASVQPRAPERVLSCRPGLLSRR